MVHAFRLFVFLKMHSSGKLHEGSPVFELAKRELGIKDSRTMKKYLSQLRKADWVGFNQASGYYFIRSFSQTPIDPQYVDRTAVLFLPENLKYFHFFLVGAILGHRVKRQKFFFEVARKRRLRPATEKHEVARQAKAFSGSSNEGYFGAKKPPYYGLSNKRIAEILGCKQTRACVLKRQAAKHGFLNVRHHFKEIGSMAKADVRLGNARYDCIADGHKLRFITLKVNGITTTKLVEQLTDELIPVLKYRSIRRFAKVPKTKAFSSSHSSAKK